LAKRLLYVVNQRDAGGKTPIRAKKKKKTVKRPEKRKREDKIESASCPGGREGEGNREMRRETQLSVRRDSRRGLTESWIRAKENGKDPRRGERGGWWGTEKKKKLWCRKGGDDVDESGGGRKLGKGPSKGGTRSQGLRVHSLGWERKGSTKVAWS